MNSCVECKYAQWKRASDGRMHKDKSGRCTFVWVPSPMPMAFTMEYGVAGFIKKPQGGFIERNHPYQNCPTFEMNNLK